MLCYNIFPKIPLLYANCEISLNSTFVRLLSKKGKKIWICKFFFKGRHSLKKIFFFTTFFEMQMQGQKKESNRIYCKLMMRKLCIYYHSNNWKKICNMIAKNLHTAKEKFPEGFFGSSILYINKWLLSILNFRQVKNTQFDFLGKISL